MGGEGDILDSSTQYLICIWLTVINTDFSDFIDIGISYEELFIDLATRDNNNITIKLLSSISSLFATIDCAKINGSQAWTVTEPLKNDNTWWNPITSI